MTLKPVCVPCTCRIWREEAATDEDEGVSNDTLRDYAIDLMLQGGSPRNVAGSLVIYSRVNSVEVVDKLTGCGTCVHKDWP